MLSRETACSINHEPPFESTRVPSSYALCITISGEHQILRVTPAIDAGVSTHMRNNKEIDDLPGSPRPIVKRSGWASCRVLPTISTLLVLFAVGSALAGCSRGTPITVINQSDVPLEKLVLSGSGFSEDIGTVRPHAELRALVRPRGESGLQIRFTAGGKEVSFGPEGYFEGGGGYIVVASVSPSLAVSVKSELTY